MNYKLLLVFAALLALASFGFAGKIFFLLQLLFHFLKISNFFNIQKWTEKQTETAEPRKCTEKDCQTYCDKAGYYHGYCLTYSCECFKPKPNDDILT